MLPHIQSKKGRDWRATTTPGAAAGAGSVCAPTLGALSELRAPAERAPCLQGKAPPGPTLGWGDTEVTSGTPAMGFGGRVVQEGVGGGNKRVPCSSLHLLQQRGHPTASPWPSPALLPAPLLTYLPWAPRNRHHGTRSRAIPSAASAIIRGIFLHCVSDL